MSEDYRFVESAAQNFGPIFHEAAQWYTSQRRLSSLPLGGIVCAELADFAQLCVGITDCDVIAKYRKLNQDCFDLLDPAQEFVQEGFTQLIEEEQEVARRHRGVLDIASNLVNGAGYSSRVLSTAFLEVFPNMKEYLALRDMPWNTYLSLFELAGYDVYRIEQKVGLKHIQRAVIFNEKLEELLSSQRSA